jgi:outer membrane protein TolC
VLRESVGRWNRGWSHRQRRRIRCDVEIDIDLFGKYGRLLEASNDPTEALIGARNAVVITVIAKVARNHMERRGLQARFAVVRDNIVRAEKTVDLVQTRFDRGLTNELDVTLAKRELAIRRSPASAHRAAPKAGLFRIRPHASAPAQPVELLRRRPDIRQAEPSSPPEQA